ncbi:iron chelate uptake ABC transporter family permease subunit [Candidatus Dojkabacteria bacterium]|nr:iron chelate uptake ABC transporter family permease subunit [Candidatus Dojkabacteria bacterium]
MIDIVEHLPLSAVAAAVLIALICGILGVFVVLKNESFISDGIAHGSLLGVAIGLIFFEQPVLLAILVAVIMALTLSFLKSRADVKPDAAIGIVYPFMFALGLILMNVGSIEHHELETFMFGDLHAVIWSDVALLLGILAVVAVLLIRFYREIVLITFDAEFADLNGICVAVYETSYRVLLSIVIVLCIKTVGVVLVTSLFVISVVSARFLAKNFKQILLFSVLHNVFSVLLALLLVSVIPVHAFGSLIVVASVAILLVIMMFFKRR